MDTHLTHHAIQRGCQRGLSSEEIAFVLQHAQRVRNAGVIFCQMRGKDMPQYLSPNHHFRRLEGVTVVLCSCEESVITTYHNPGAFKKDRSKQKYDHHTQGCCSCSHKSRQI